MTTSPEAESATIYPFPARGRFAATTAPGQDTCQDTSWDASQRCNRAEPARARLPRVVSGSGWYHDAAIEAERAGAQ
ncbi:MAG TPA: DUF2735 domain-containing protein [Xanthobacteraceae bacterium]|nr:DUF2735 domain-containing protein [Xanthobacteraceae bacterium]